MKKSVLLFLCFFPIVVLGKPISEKTARQIASDFFLNKISEVKLSANHNNESIKRLTLEKTELCPILYSYTVDSGGFIVISGDDISNQILMYSDDKNISLEDDNVQLLLRWYYELLSKASKIAISTAPVQHVKSSTENPNNSTDEILIDLPKWTLRSPYNNMLPLADPATNYGEEHKLPASITEFFACLFRYYKWPENGTGHLDGMPEYGIKGYDLGHKYDWDNMPWSHKDPHTEYQAQQIAQLYYDISVANRFFFEDEGGHQKFEERLKTAVESAANHFGYDPLVKRVPRKDFNSIDDWKTVLRNELQEGRPFALSLGKVSLNDNGGTVVMGNYTFVNGYDGTRFRFHSHGADLWADIFPVDMPPTLLDLYMSQVAYINIKPKKNGDQAVVPDIPLAVSGSSTIYPLMTSWHYEQNRSFQIKGGVIVGLSEYFLSQLPAESYEIAWGLVDEAGAIKELISDKYLDEDLANSINARRDRSINYNRSFRCTITGPINKTDRISLCYKKDSDSAWRVFQDLDGGSIMMSHEKPLEELVSMFFVKDKNLHEGWKNLDYDYIKEDFDLLIIKKPAGVAIELLGNNGEMEGNLYYQSNLDFPERDCRYNICHNRIFNVSPHISPYLIRRDKEKPIIWNVRFYDIEDSFEIEITL